MLIRYPVVIAVAVGKHWAVNLSLEVEENAMGARNRKQMFRFWSGVVLSLFACLPLAVGAEKHALLIGVTKYRHVKMNTPQLEYPEVDAKAVGALLRESDYQVVYLLGREATKKAIEAKFDEISKVGESDGVLVIGLFGHGVEYEKTKEAFYCPYDTTIREVNDEKGRPKFDRDGQRMVEPDPSSLVSMASCLRTLALSPSGHKLLLADCCREQPNRARGGAFAGPIKERAFGASLKLSDLPDNTAALFACSANESAFEDNEWGHGAMTKILLGELRRHSDAGSLTKPLRDGVLALVRDKRNTQTVHPLVNGVVDLQLNLGSGIEGKTPGEERTISGIKFCWIPAGSFTMGSPPDEKEREKDENQVQVRLTRGFWLGKYETTQAEYEQVMGKNPSYFSTLGGGKEHVDGMDTRRFPVEIASWNDAMEYCEKLTAQAHSRRELPLDWKYTLPTEAQWEYACRAGTDTPFHFGEILNGKQANMDGNYPYGTAEKGPYLQRTARVGSYPANTWNVHDMHGNVWEWCQDTYQETLPGGVDPAPTAGRVLRVLRGGSWFYVGRYCRSAHRDWFAPAYRDYYDGFRAVAVPAK